MANERNRGDNEHNLGHHGPAREENIEQREEQRNDLDDQGTQQTDSHDSRLGSGPETIARRSGDASGAPGGPSHLGEAEHAFERSRGEERRR